jgi:hypothetical protein
MLSKTPFLLQLLPLYTISFALHIFSILIFFHILTVNFSCYPFPIFSENTEHRDSIILQIIYYNIYMIVDASFNPTPCFPSTHVYLLGEPASLLVVANTHPPLSLVCQQLPHSLLALPPFHTPQFRLHYLHRRHQQLQLSLSGTSRVQ